jgi:hypothetical protein
MDVPYDQGSTPLDSKQRLTRSTTFVVPQDLFLQFKEVLSQEGVSMAKAVEQFMESYVHCLDPLPESLWQRRITLQDLFSLTLHAKRLGYANWVSASLILDMGPHSPHAAGALSLLIALEIVTPTDHWQKRHETGPLMGHALHIMEKEIRKKGFVHWLDEAGVYFKARLREGVVGMNLGWVRSEHIREFLEVLEGRAIHEQPSKGPLFREGSDSEKQAEKHWLPKTPETEQLTLPF